MKLKTVQARLPGCEASVDFSRPTIIMGPNDSGKTSLLQSPVTALAGNQEALGANGLVQITFDDGYTVRRSMYADKHQLVAGVVSGVRKAQPLITQRIGRAGAFSATDFLGLSPEKKRQSLDESGVVRIDLSVEDAQRHLEGLDQGCLDKLSVIDTGNGHTYLQKALDVFRAAYKGNETSIRELRGAIKSYREPTGLPHGTVASARRRIADLDEQLKGLARQRGELDGSKVARESLQERLVAVEIKTTQLAYPSEEDIQRKREASETHQATATKLHSQIAIEEERQKGLALSRTTEEDKLTEARKRLAEMVAALSRANAVRRAVATLQVLITAATNAVEVVGTQEEAMFELNEVLSRVKALSTSTSIKEDVQRFKDEVSGLETKLGAVKRRLSGADSTVKTLNSRWQSATKRTPVATMALNGAIQSREAALNTLVELGKEKETLTEKLAELGTADTSSIDAAEKGLNIDRKSTTKDMDRLNDHAATLAIQEERRATLNLKIQLRATLGTAGSKVRDVLRMVLAEAIAPVTDVASNITQAVLGMRLEVRMLCGIQLVLAGKEHSVRVSRASNSQRMVALMALQVAVQGRMSGWRHVLLDDLEGLEKERRTAFVEAMAQEMSQGRIHNFVGACVDDGWTPPESVQVIRLET